MPSFNAKQRTRHLSERIKLLHEKGYVPSATAAITLDYSSRVTDLVIRLIRKGGLQYPVPSYSDLEKYYESFPDKDKFSLATLKEKHWFRVVMNRVTIPSSISSATSDLSKADFSKVTLIQGLDELIKKSPDQYLSEAEIQTYCDNYNMENEEKIDLEILRKEFLYNGLRDEKFVLQSRATYILILWQNKEALQFIYQFKGRYHLGSHNHFKIEKAEADKIITEHRTVYPNCPSAEQFIQDGFFVSEEAHYLIKQINSGKVKYLETFHHAIAGRLWALYKQDNSFTNDELRLDSWLDVVLSFHDYPSECFKYMEEETSNEFLALIEKRLVEDDDIKGCDSELDKLWLEENMGLRSDSLVRQIQYRFSESQTFYEKYELVEEILNRHHNLFYSDACRNRLDFLVHILLNTGHISEEPIHAFPTIIRLLKLSTDKPYLLWQTCISLEHRHPEIIPYLLLEKGLEGVGFKLLKKIKINHFALDYPDDNERLYQIFKFKIELLKESFKTLLACIFSPNNSEGQGDLLAKIISDYGKKLYVKPRNFTANELLERNDEFNVYDSIWEILANTPSQTKHIGNDVIEHSLIFYFIARDFLNGIVNEEDEEAWNEFYLPKVYQIDIAIRVIKIIRNPILFNRNTLSPNVISELDKIDLDTVRFIHNAYKGFFEKKEVTVRTHATTEVEEIHVRFLSSSYAIERIEWGLYLQSLSTAGKKEFFNVHPPDFDFSKYVTDKDAVGSRTDAVSEDEGVDSALDADSEGDDDSELTDRRLKMLIINDEDIANEAHRLRFHIRVMLCAFNLLIEQQMSDEELINALQNELSDLFCEYSEIIIEKNLCDIFDKTLEAYSGVNLFSDFLEAANYFTEQNRRKIIDRIVENEGQLDRVLLALNTFSAEGDQSYLRGKLTEEKMEAFLEDQYYLPEIENALINSINNPHLVTYAEQILKFLEGKTNISARRELQHKIILFEVKLIIAYRKEDMAMLEATEVPEENNYGRNDNNVALEARKSYFKACILWKKEQFEEALNILDRLSISPNVSFRVLNARFSLQIEIAKKQHKDDLYELKKEVKKALDTILAAEKERDYKIEDFYKEELLFNKLEAYNLLGWDEEFDAQSVQVKSVDRFSQQFAELFLLNKVRRQQSIEAESFIQQLKKYHTNRAGEIPEFIRKFEMDLNTSQKSIAYIGSAYHLFLGLTEQDRVKALPDIITKYKNDYGEFLLYEIVRACAAFQNKQYALLKSGDLLDVLEDKITDMIEVIANSRLSAWGIQLSSQNRTGTTGKNTNELARADLSTPMGLTTVIVESVRIYSYKSLESEKRNLEYHILKSFNETANRKYFYHLIYYQADNFVDDWKEFITGLLPTVSYPSQFSIKGTSEEMKDFSFTDLKVAKTIHEEGVVCYYIFVNLNYPISILRKVVSRVAKLRK